MTALKLTQLPDGLAPLAMFRQFILWERVPMRVYNGTPTRRRDLLKAGLTLEQINGLPAANKTEKLPTCPYSLHTRDAHDPAIHLDFETAALTASDLPEQYGVGFVFTTADPFYFVDVDSCADPSQQNGWSPRANELMTRLAGASVEVSQSGQGLHIIGMARQLPPRSCKYLDEFDLYTEGRFVALTGYGVVGSAAHDSTAALTEICHQYLPPRPGANAVTGDVELTDGPCEGWDGHRDDVELISHALNATSLFAEMSGRASFRALWERDVEALSRAYPPDQGAQSDSEYDQSAADMALAQHLAFWTGKDGLRIERLMRLSALVRDKWDDRAGYYLPRTIGRACAMQTDVHKSRTATAETNALTLSKPIDPETLPSGITPTVGMQLMPVTSQPEHFKGCVYVMDRDRILTPLGDMLKSSQFKAMYGGYTFCMDHENRTTTRNAWEVFTESQALRFPKVHTISFRPLDTPGEFTTDQHGRRSVNCFTPRWGAQIPGDVEPFINHIKKLLPDENDREILLSYLAACVQRAGEKFQWCVVLQGLMGNGKTALTEPLVHALGEPYVFQLNPRDAGNVFNAWVERKLMVVLEEIRVAGKTDLVDSLKPLITNRRIPIQGKGIDQTTGDNFANFVMFSNHKDAVLKTLDDRRYCVFYTAQQDIDDLQRDGMDDRYFSELYAYLRGPGNSAVAHYLANRPISVNVMGRAPNTSSTAAACRESLGTAEQILQEAVELDKPGFRGGLMSSVHAGIELAANGKRVSPRAVGNILRQINYVIHPALVSTDGRMMSQNQRFRVYVLKGHDAAQLDHDGVRRRWEELNR